MRTFGYVGISLALCFAIGYPVAYYMARYAGRTKGILLACIVLPFWMSYLMRMLAWVNLLNPEGRLGGDALDARRSARTALRGLGLGNGGEVWFGQPITVIMGLVYGYIPFFILPLYASLDRIDGRYLEAARDLGASAKADVPDGSRCRCRCRGSSPRRSSPPCRCSATTTRTPSSPARRARR